MLQDTTDPKHRTIKTWERKKLIGGVEDATRYY